ncbi:cell division protein FtsZ [Candidatus Spongiihabitans sp.]|uniref:cell division protein FtsZ n=1 Tax=Candidatus Spongiihabitans sp. TaxID=3101308 RepID=UPI003C7D10BF
MFELVDTISQRAVIKVIGVGGGGGNAVEHMLTAALEGVSFINANTDAQMLSQSKADTVLQLGENLTKGLGAGADPVVGRQAAMEDIDRIAAAIDGADMLFITAGMGGGTGTGAAPVIAELAREKGALTVAVVTRPFSFEGRKRQAIADRGIEELQDYVDSLITIPNEKVLAVMGQNAPMMDAFNKANEVLFNAVQGIAELITRPGLINVDFADVRTVMAERGVAMMGSATVSGENRALEATQQAISSPLLEDINLHGAKGLLVNITAGPDMAIGEFETVGNAIYEYAAEDANVVIGTAVDPAMQGDLRVTMVATGLVDPKAKVTLPEHVENNPAKPVQAVNSIEHKMGRILPQKQFTRMGVVTAEATPLDSKQLDIPSFLRKQAD